VLKTQKDKDLLPKFALLKALAVGKTQPQQSFETSLGTVVTKFPGTESAKKAQEILDAIKTKKTAQPEVSAAQDTVSGQAASKELYKYEPEAFHFYIAVIEMKAASINDIRNAYSNLNTKYYSTKKYKIDTWFLDDKHEVLNVNRFDNKNDAMNYLMALENNKELLETLQKTSYSHFVISAANYPVFYQSKDVDKYLSFFMKNYKK